MAVCSTWYEVYLVDSAGVERYNGDAVAVDEVYGLPVLDVGMCSAAARIMGVTSDKLLLQVSQDDLSIKGFLRGLQVMTLRRALSAHNSAADDDLRCQRCGSTGVFKRMTLVCPNHPDQILGGL